jgi:hypothetical protein
MAQELVDVLENQWGELVHDDLASKEKNWIRNLIRRDLDYRDLKERGSKVGKNDVDATPDIAEFHLPVLKAPWEVLKCASKTSHRSVFAPVRGDYVVKVGRRDPKRREGSERDAEGDCLVEAARKPRRLLMPSVLLHQDKEVVVTMQPRCKTTLGNILRMVRDQNTFTSAVNALRRCFTALEGAFDPPEDVEREGTSDGHADNWGLFVNNRGHKEWFLIDAGGFQEGAISRKGACRPTQVLSNRVLSAQGKHGCNTITHKLQVVREAVLQQNADIPAWEVPPKVGATAERRAASGTRCHWCARCQWRQ